MPRYIIECDDPTGIFLGMRAIKNLKDSGDALAILEFDNGSLWFVNKTKTGYSARTAGKK